MGVESPSYTQKKRLPNGLEWMLRDKIIIVPLERMDRGECVSPDTSAKAGRKAGQSSAEPSSLLTLSTTKGEWGERLFPRVGRAVVASRRMRGTQKAAERWRYGKQWVLARRRRLLNKWDCVIDQLSARQHKNKAWALPSAPKLPPVKPPPKPPLRVAGPPPPSPAAAASWLQQRDLADWKSPPLTTFSPEHIDGWGGSYWHERNNNNMPANRGFGRQPYPPQPVSPPTLSRQAHHRRARPRALQPVQPACEQVRAAQGSPDRKSVV